MVETARGNEPMIGITKGLRKLSDVGVEFSEAVMQEAWGSATEVIRDLGENPEDILLQASETVKRAMNR